MAETNSSPISSSSSDAFDGVAYYRINVVSELPTGVTASTFTDGNALGEISATATNGWTGKSKYNSSQTVTYKPAASIGSILKVDDNGIPFVDIYITAPSEGFAADKGASFGIATGSNPAIPLINSTIWWAGGLTKWALTTDDFSKSVPELSNFAGSYVYNQNAEWTTTSTLDWDSAKYGMASTTGKEDYSVDPYNGMTNNTVTGVSQWRAIRWASTTTVSSSYADASYNLQGTVTPALTGNLSVQLSSGLVAVLPVSGGALEVLTTRFTLKILFIIFIVYILTKALIQILCYN